MATEKYKEFRNFMFNELGVTRDDVRQWAKEAVLEAAERRARSVDVERIVDRAIDAKVRAIIEPRYGQPSRVVQDQIRKAVADIIADRLKISVAKPTP